ncbi:MAG: hypothetical protein GF317_09680 [Candidatus Lokiarchaeota archaeon]|nr:hypothetical protein [Candidatus Lokiarchaeota archaeon]MBD3199980.1 hypothetical protein [Candidatus Lokiarchaeota archaeon]
MSNKDDYDDFIDRIKKYFKLNSDSFDAEFYLFPESRLGERLGLNPKDIKNGIRVSFHYEKGMDEPDIKIHGDFDEEKVKNYLKHLSKQNFRINPQVKNFMRTQKDTRNDEQKILDAQDLSVEPNMTRKDLSFEEPFTEIHEHEDCIEIILEVPGIKENEIFIGLNDENKILTFEADNNKRRYHKKIKLPCSGSILNETLEVNNGIVIFKCNKKQ